MQEFLQFGGWTNEQTDVPTMEAMLKIMTFGFIAHHNTYLRNPWNQLDFVVVVIREVIEGNPR